MAELAQLFFDWTPVVGSFWHTLWLNNDKQQGNTVLGPMFTAVTHVHTYTVHTQLQSHHITQIHKPKVSKH